MFSGPVALVTGAASGIGRALALQLAADGARLVLCDIDGSRCSELAREILSAGGSAEAHALDVSDAASFERICGAAVAAHGGIDFLFNNAGIAVGGDVRDIALADWQRIVDVNLMGVVHGVHAAYPHMAARGSGHIVNTASVAGLVPFAPLTPYSMTKHAVVGLSLSLRAEAAALGVRVSTVCPGFIESGIYDAARMARLPGPSGVRSLALFKPMPTELAARRILAGVARNRAVIVFPFYARVLWWIARIHPSLAEPLGRYTVRKFRAMLPPRG